MEKAIIDFLNNYHWNWLVVTAAAIFILLTNSASTNFFVVIFNRFTKTKVNEDKHYPKKFTLLKITSSVSKWDKVTLEIIYFIYIVFLCYAKYIVAVKKLDNVYNILIYIGVVLVSFSLFDLLFTIKKRVKSMELEGDPDALFRAYLSILFDMNMSIISLDSSNLELMAYLNGNELGIKINDPDSTDRKMEVIFTRKSNSAGVVFYSSELRNIIRNLIKNTSYPKVD